jgi:hypothetical protein
MNLWGKIVSELAAHRVGVRPDGAVTLQPLSPTSEDATYFASAKEAAAHVRGKSEENAEFLLSLWKQVAAALPTTIEKYPSNDGTRRMFISALKHLCVLAGTSKMLGHLGVTHSLHASLLEDSSGFSQDVMSRVVDFRLAIDWVAHLVEFDRYRAELLDALAMGKGVLNDPSVKIASYGSNGRDFSIPESFGTPWFMIRSTLRNHRAEPTPDDDGIDRSMRWRTEKGLEESPQGEHGQLDHQYERIVDQVTHGRYFKRPSGTMADIFDNNQKWMDHSSDGWTFDQPENFGPASQRTSILGR